MHVFVYFLQWIQCDMRYFDMTVLGKFSVVMADPPWDIHMEVHTVFFYYPTALPRVQITLKTITNITRYLYSRGPVRQVSCH